MTLGRINKIETFGSVDGPGVRFVVFMQGCTMRCLYCHNPETWQFKTKETFEISAEDLLKKALRYKTYWGYEGGITISGGEPLLQIDFLLEFFELCKKENIHTCIDTSGVNFIKEEPFFSKFNQLMKFTDLLLVDLKVIDPKIHKKLTGHDLKNNQRLFFYLNEINKPVWVRHVLVPEITDNDELLLKTRDFLKQFHNIQKVEILPYHSLALTKYKKLGINYSLIDTKSPSLERVENAKKILETF